MTVFFIASKVEESAARLTEIIDKFNKLKQQPMTINSMYVLKCKSNFIDKDILECEFDVLATLNFDLIIFHPYRPLAQFLSDARLEEECLQTAWNIVNDTYRTNIVLTCPPYLIALASFWVACIYVGKNPQNWFNNLNVKQSEVRYRVFFVKIVFF
jgi:cyclin C